MCYVSWLAYHYLCMHFFKTLCLLYVHSKKCLTTNMKFNVQNLYLSLLISMRA